MSNDLVVIETISAQVVFIPGGVDAILEKITNEVRSIKTDISTSQGRAAVASLAYKVARSKTALDEMGKDLVSELKAKTGAIDAERRTIREKLDNLKDEVRKPLTDWENADKLRREGHEKAILDMEALLDFGGEEPTSAQLQERIDILAGRQPREWQEFVQRASEVALRVGKRLEDFHTAAVAREAERAELERLRREQIEREQRERDERIAAEAAERARIEAETRAENAARTAALEAAKEQERLERERNAATLAAAQAEEKRAKQVEQAERDAQDAAEAAEKRRLQAVEDERARVAAIHAQEAAETARREADRKHRGNVNNQVLAALVLATAGEGRESLSQDQAVAIVKAIAQGKVPHTRIAY